MDHAFRCRTRGAGREDAATAEPAPSADFETCLVETTDPTMSHVHSYYAASAHTAPACPVLQGEESFDVCVVGAGIAGCATALELAERGYRVALLEAERVGWGASGRSGGQAIFGFGTSQAKLAAQVGIEAARRMWDVSIDALDWMRDRVARHHIDCDLRWGHLHVATKPRQIDELRELQRELSELYGYQSPRFLDRIAVEALLATTPGSTTPAADTCTRSITRSVSPALPRPLAFEFTKARASRESRPAILRACRRRSARCGRGTSCSRAAPTWMASTSHRMRT
jgi:glycine/D-amino acid oxidase-like deaminating enzyme